MRNRRALAPWLALLLVVVAVPAGVRAGPGDVAADVDPAPPADAVADAG